MPDSTRPGPLGGRIALVTGASRGIGAATARRLAAAGAHVVLVARTVGGLEEVDDSIRAAGGSATLIPQDLTQFDRLDQLGPALFERFGRLDILVAAAGDLGVIGPLAHADVRAWERVMAVTVHANMRLIRSLDPLLRGSDAGRAVFLTDRVGHQPTAYWNGYAAAKAALDMMVMTWAAEVLRSPLKINLADPGPVATKLRAKAFPGEDQSRLPTPDEAAEWLLDLALPACTRHGERVSR
jgi:NAD(P)-dependent dehydrogenase (short-subunit alcohol dehydrogenase family)